MDSESGKSEVVTTVVDEGTGDSSGLNQSVADAPVTVVIPAFNEAETIGPVVEQLQKHVDTLVKEVIVVDDGSTDETGEIATRLGATVIRHVRNRGYGAALKLGIRRAQTEFVLTMDADGQHSGSQLIPLWHEHENADMVVGARKKALHSPIWRMPGKWLLSAMANYLMGEKIPDLNSGLRLIRREVALKYLHICPSGFSLSTTMTLALLNRKWRVEWVPIEVSPRAGRSTVSVATGLETVVLILRLMSLFHPLRVFLPLSVCIGIVGVLWGTPYVLTGGGVSIGAMLAFVTSVLLFSLGLICDQISQLRLERYE